jgi:hypothetical protein
MKRLAIITILAVGVVSGIRAQETRIIAFTAPATLTWTNSQTNVYYVIDYTWDLGYDWTATWDPALNIVATTSVSSVQLDPLVQALTNVWSQLQFKINPPLFYRIVSCAEPLSPRYTTNDVMLSNASTSTLTEVSLGYQPTDPLVPRSQITNLVDLAPGNSTAYYPFYEKFPDSGALSQEYGVFFHFVQGGQVRDRVLSIIGWGPPGKRLHVTASNDSCTVRYEWLNLQGTVPW